MYKNILIPVVLDDEAKILAAFDAAKVLADDGARMTLLHVIEAVPVYVADYIPTDFIMTTRSSVNARLDALAKLLPNCHVAIAEGKAGPRITRWAAENSMDCIVISSHEPAFSDILLGSVAHHVVRHAKCAVHVLR